MEDEKIKKFEQGFAHKFQVDSTKVRDWCIDLIHIHNHLLAEEMYVERN